MEATSPPSEAPAGGFLAGALYPLRALALINRNRQLWRYILVPILINIAAGVLLYAGLFTLGWQLLSRLGESGNPLFAGLVGALLLVALFVGLPFGIAWLLVRFGVVLGAPWYGQLSEELEWLLTGRRPAQTQLTAAEVAYDIWRALQFEAKKLGLFLAIGLPALLLNLIPVAGQILATVVGAGLGTTIACLDFFDSPLERRRLRFRDKLALIRRALPASAGFGLVAFGLVTIPLINLLAIPLCVTAGTMFVVERALPDERPAGG